MAEEWGEPSRPLSPGEIEAGRARVREIEETRRWRMQMVATGVGLVCGAAVLLGITGALFQGHKDSVENEKAKSVACVQAGGTWTENSSSNYECRRG